ncbi:MAG: VWA domain-containing protein [Blastochloris sp.]|nr:VWA domain-containing protein [Blastochloris sp.]
MAATQELVPDVKVRERGGLWRFLGLLLERPTVSFACAAALMAMLIFALKDEVIQPAAQEENQPEWKVTVEQAAPILDEMVAAPGDQEKLEGREIFSVTEAPLAEQSAADSMEVMNNESSVLSMNSVTSDFAATPRVAELKPSGSRVGGAAGLGATGAMKADVARTQAAQSSSPRTVAPPAPMSTPVNPSQSVSAGKSKREFSDMNFRGEVTYGSSIAPTSSGNEDYVAPAENPFRSVADEPLSTFSIDVDTASYTNLRRILNQGQRPPPEAVRIEEMLNYFDYAYPSPQGSEPFALHLEAARCPWNAEHQLLRVGIQGRRVGTEQRPPLNLVFLIDVSGSMSDDNKLPLVKKSLALLVRELKPTDRVALVTYAGRSRLALPSTSAREREVILAALENLESGGSTNGEGGIRQAYEVAREHLNKKGINRVILATDGDFNVGVSDREELVRLIQDEARSGVFLNVFGFGMGNLKDATLEQLANKGNGVYGYIDSFQEARKVFVNQINSTLVTIAKDVKIQIEFNPALVGAYRLIGYENRMLNKEDFNDDRKDAGEVGAGHSVTALYELVPAGREHGSGVDPLKYQRSLRTPPTRLSEAAGSGEWLTLKLRYKEPNGSRSQLIQTALRQGQREWRQSSDSFRFAAAVAGFGLLLKESPYRGSSSPELVRQLAGSALEHDPEGYRREFLRLVETAQNLR